MNKEKIALWLNIILILSELVGFIWTIKIYHSISIEYYTNDSNLLALFSSVLFVIFYKKEKEFVKDLRFITTACLTITFLVVIFILAPMYDNNYKLLMFTNIFFIFHTLCPILSMISYFFFEKGSKKKHTPLIATAIYGVILIILNIFRVVNGPYPFLQIYDSNIVKSIILMILILAISEGIGIEIYYLKNKRKS